MEGSLVEVGKGFAIPKTSCRQGFTPLVKLTPRDGWVELTFK